MSSPLCTVAAVVAIVVLLTSSSRFHASAADVTPLLLCVTDQGDGAWAAHFAYSVNGGGALDLKPGSDGNLVAIDSNFFPNGLPLQPSFFDGSLHPSSASFDRLFTVGIANHTDVQWHLAGKMASINYADPDFKKFQCPGEVQMSFTVMMNPCNDAILVKSILLANLADVISTATNGEYALNRLRLISVNFSQACPEPVKKPEGHHTARGIFGSTLLVPTEIRIAIDSYESLPSGGFWIDTTLPSFDLAAALRPASATLVKSIVDQVPDVSIDENHNQLKLDLSTFPRKNGSPSPFPYHNPFNTPSKYVTPPDESPLDAPFLGSLNRWQFALVVGASVLLVMAVSISTFYVYRRRARRGGYSRLDDAETGHEAQNFVSPRK